MNLILLPISMYLHVLALVLWLAGGNHDAQGSVLNHVLRLIDSVDRVRHGQLP